MNEGTRVRFVREVERYPHFVVPEGRTGTVTVSDDNEIRVRLDEALEGADEWADEVHWYSDMFVDEEFDEVFREDVEPLA